MMAAWDDETNETSNSNDSDLQSDSLKSESCFEWNDIPQSLLSTLRDQGNHALFLKTRCQSVLN